MRGACRSYYCRMGLIVVMALLTVTTACSKDTANKDLDEAVVVKDEQVRGLLEEAIRDVSPDGTLDGRLDSIENPSWERDKTPVTIDWYVTYDWFNKSYEPETNLGDMKLLEHTGISVNIITGNVDELNTLVAKGELPDIITSSSNSRVIREMESKGMLHPLNDLISQYAQDTNVPQSMIDWYTTQDDNWYRYVSFFSSDERVNESYGGYEVTHNGNWVRQDLLDEIGMTLEDMSTKEGFLKTLLKVKEEEITYNGELVTPFVLDVWYGAVAVRFAEQFGVDYEDEEGNFVNVFRTPEYLEALLFLNEMYTLGLFTDEALTMNKDQIDAKVSRGSAFAANGWVTVRDGSKNLWHDDPDAKMVDGGIIQGGENGREPILMATNSAGWSATVISKASDHPDRAIQLLSYLSQEEVMLDITHGTGTYQVVNGRAIRDEGVDQLEREDKATFDAKYNFNLGLILDSNINFRYERLTDNWYYNNWNQHVTEPVSLICSSKAFSSVEPEDGTNLSMVWQRITEYKDRALPAVIMARSQEECESLYHDFIEGLDSLGMVEYDRYRNERFQLNKEKLGVEHVWLRHIMADE